MEMPFLQKSAGITSDASPPDPAPCEPGNYVTSGPADLIAFDTHSDPLAFLGGLLDQYGDVVRYQTRFGPCFFFVHPEHVQAVLHREVYRRASLVKMVLGDGLLASDGPRWRSQRRLMQRDFLPRNVAPFVSVMARETALKADAWRAAAAANKALDVATEMTRLTLRIVVDALFSVDLADEQVLKLCAAVTQIINDVGRISWTIFGASVQFTPDSNAGFIAAKNVIDALCYDMIARRRSLSPPDRPRDLLTMLIEADTEDGPLDDRQLRDEIVTMLVGGHETTALALAWAWKAIAENPEIEAKIHQEVDAVLAGRSPDLADLSNLPWTRATFHEALRLYPPVWVTARVASKEDVIAGHTVPRGACVLVSAWFTHRHKEFWPEAERFNPARFIEPAQPPHRYAFFPFGGGRHRCLGTHFALLEGTLILAQLAQGFRVRPLAGQQIRPHPAITLRQAPGMCAYVEPRQVIPTGTLKEKAGAV
jgi:cytochrome P450